MKDQIKVLATTTGGVAVGFLDRLIAHADDITKLIGVFVAFGTLVYIVFQTILSHKKRKKINLEIKKLKE